jgi:hypothetical protein
MNTTQADPYDNDFERGLGWLWGKDKKKAQRATAQSIAALYCDGFTIPSSNVDHATHAPKLPDPCHAIRHIYAAIPPI